MSKELWTIIIDAVVSVTTIAVGIWVAPEYSELALASVAALQGVAGALVVEFRGQRRDAQTRQETQRALRQMAQMAQQQQRH